MPTQADPSGVETIGMPDLARPCQLVIAAPVSALVAVALVMVQLESGRPRSVSEPSPSLLSERVTANSEPAERWIAGRTLSDWRELMNSLEHDAPERSQHIAALTEIAQTPDLPWFTRRQAALTLGRWGDPAGVAVLVGLLDSRIEDPDEAPALWALKGLSLMGPGAQSAGPRVGQIAGDPSRPLYHRLVAIECLSQIGSAYPAGVATLMQTALIVERDYESLLLRRAAIEAIGRFRGGASVTVPVLMHALDDEDVDIRREAGYSLGRQGQSAEIAQTALFDKLVSDPDPAVRDVTGVSLAQTGPGVIPAMLTLLDQEDAELRLRAATVLANLGRTARSTAPAIKQHWDDPDATVRLAMLEALWRVTGSGDALAARIARELTDADRNIRRRAYLLLVALGPGAAGARSVFEQQLSHPRAEVRAVARKLLQQLP